jgi:hypothetical protein
MGGSVMPMDKNSVRSLGARAFFALTAVSVSIGVALELWLAYHARTGLPPHAGFTRTFGPGIDGGLNQLVFFTTESNAILGLTTLLLAIRLHRSSEVFHVFRLVGLIDIAITAVVYNLLLAGDVKPQGVGEVANVIQHMINPALAWIGWLVFGPARLVTVRRVALAALVPLAWGVVTLVRGAFIDWYPYSILDVPRLGYGGVALYILGVLALFFVIAGVLAVVDRQLGTTPFRASEQAPDRRGTAVTPLGTHRSEVIQ